MTRMRCLSGLIALYALLCLPATRAAGPGLSTGDGGWCWANLLPQGNDLNGLFVLSTSEAWAVGRFGTILHTADGGQTWRSQDSGATSDLRCVFFLNSREGWASGDGLFLFQSLPAMILHTTDGGATWWPQSSFSTWPINAIHFTDPLNGWAVGMYGTIRHTTDGGVTWQKVSSAYQVSFSNVYFADKDHGWITGGYLAGTTGGARCILRTEDAGATWTGVYATGVPTIGQVQFFDTREGWAAGSALQHSTDGGVTWVIPPAAPPEAIAQVRFTDRMHGFAVGQSVWTTSDGGDTWTRRNPAAAGTKYQGTYADPDRGFRLWGDMVQATADSGGTWFPAPDTQDPGTEYVSISFPDPLHGWAVEQYGRVFHTEDGGRTWVWQVPNTALHWTYGRFYYVKFADALNGWVGPAAAIYTPDAGGIFHTTDGGKTWERQEIPGGGGWNVWPIDAQTVWTGKSVSTDGGKTWTEKAPGWGEVQFIDRLHGFQMNQYTISRTEDGGETWTEGAAVPDGLVINHMAFGDPLNGGVIAADYAGADAGANVWGVYHTTDGGRTWTTQSLDMEANDRLHAILFTDTVTGWMCSHYGRIWHTTDGGRHWDRQASGTQYELHAMCALNGHELWAAGDEAAILHTTTGGSPPGDADGSGAIELTDVALALRTTAGLGPADAATAARTDVNGDGKAGIDDIPAILRRAPYHASFDGFLEKASTFSGRYGTNLLSQTGGPDVALISMRLFLDRFAGQRVRVSGDIVPGYPAYGGPALMAVTSVHVLP